MNRKLKRFSSNYDEKCISNSQTILLTFTFIYYTQIIIGKHGWVYLITAGKHVKGFVPRLYLVHEACASHL